MFAYLDASGVVLSVAKADQCVVDVVGGNAVMGAIPLANISPSVVQKVSGAPDSIKPFGDEGGVYHRKTSGDGTAVEDYTELEFVVPLQDKRVSEIDVRTRELIAQGFIHVPANKTFSLSANAQQNWTGLLVAEGNSMVSYPAKVTTADDDEYELVDAAALLAFCADALDTVKGHLDSGRALKVAIKAATTRAALDAIVDDR